MKKEGGCHWGGIKHYIQGGRAGESEQKPESDERLGQRGRERADRKMIWFLLQPPSERKREPVVQTEMVSVGRMGECPKFGAHRSPVYLML